MVPFLINYSLFGKILMWVAGSILVLWILLKLLILVAEFVEVVLPYIIYGLVILVIVGALIGIGILVF